MTGHTCNPNTWEVEAEVSEVQGHPGLVIDFEASLGYPRPCHKTKQQKNSPP